MYDSLATLKKEVYIVANGTALFSYTLNEITPTLKHNFQRKEHDLWIFYFSSAESF